MFVIPKYTLNHFIVSEAFSGFMHVVAPEFDPSDQKLLEGLIEAGRRSKRYFINLSWKNNLSFSSTACISFIIMNWLLTSDHLSKVSIQIDHRYRCVPLMNICGGNCRDLLLYNCRRPLNCTIAGIAIS